MALGPVSFSGPLTVDDLLVVWEGAVDSSYSEPLETAGLGNGFEAITQMLAQWARVSLAVDVSIQSMFIQPHSSQTQPPASGPNNATVTLSFTRTEYLDVPLVLGVGWVWVDEQQNDASPTGPVAVTTGRRYVLTENLVFFPGQAGPIDVQAQAALPGMGYNNPLPGSLNLVEQVGSGFYNDSAGVTVSTVPATLAGGALAPASPSNLVQLVTENTADTLIPEHVAQYVLFTAGANVGAVARVVAFQPPNPAATNSAYPQGQGSVGSLEQLAVLVTMGAVSLGPLTPTNPTGEFIVGERVSIPDTTLAQFDGAGTLLAVLTDTNGNTHLAVALTQGTAPPGSSLPNVGVTGVQSGASIVVDLVTASGAFVVETPTLGVGGAAWRVMDWVVDWGLSVTNALSPTGGTLGMLDLLGDERNLPRQPGEVDADYRDRIWQVADMVTPNAIKRTLARNLGANWCFREVGTALLPGIYYDRTDDPDGDCYDLGSLLFAGGYTSGTFHFEEPVNYLRGPLLLAVGFWGSLLPGTTTPQAVPGADFTLVLTRDANRNFFPNIAWQVGDTIVGTRSGAVFTPTGTLPNDFPALSRFKTYLDFLNMRAMFAVGVPATDAGDFGFAYDNGALNAYDIAPFDDFYDGFSIVGAQNNTRVWNAIQAVRAAGVTVNIYIIDEACE